MGGTICLWHLYPYIYWYFLISSYYLTVSNGRSLTTMKMHSCHFLVKQFQMGGPSAFGIYMFSLQWYFLISSLLFDCFEWGLIDCIEKHRGHSELWQFQPGGVHLPLVSTHFLYVLVFPYLTVSNGCSLTAL